MERREWTVIIIWRSGRMDQQRFDAALRALNAGATRRRGFASALGVILAGASVGAATGRPRKPGRGIAEPEGPCGDGSAAANRCTKDNDCCTRRCNARIRRCRCIQRGDACGATRNCCNSLVCTNGVCAHPAPVGPTCDPETCAGGCCDGSTCKASSAESCGANGVACAVCSGAKPMCANGACAECASSSDCVVTSDTCSNGVCRCGSTGPCGGGLVCAGSICQP